MKHYLPNSLRALFLSLAVLLSLPMLAVEVEIDGIYYDLNAEAKQATVIKKSSGEYSGNVVIPESVEFKGISHSVTSIGTRVFYYCKGLTSVTIPNSVTSIGDGAFLICFGLTSVTIGNSVTSIGYDAFDRCSGLTSVHISDIAAWCNIDFGSSRSNPLYYAHHLYLNGEEVKDLVIPDNVTSIGDYAFSGCSGLTSVTISHSVTSIGDYAFKGCSGLTSVTIGNSVKSIGDYAFSGCEGLTSVHISDIAAWCNIEFEAYDSNPLYYAHHLYLNGEEVKDLVIPNSVTSIGNRAFYGCSGLTSVTIPNSVTSIGNYAFAYCSGLTSVTIPNSVTSIGDDAFLYCSGLTSVTIPNSVTSLGYAAFYECKGLTSVTIGNSVNSIESHAFANCPELLDVYCYAEDVPSTESEAFDGSYPENATLHVPDASVDSYKTSAPWSSFGKIVAISTEVDGINYDFDAETKQATVIKKSSGKYSGEVVIPESVEYGGTAYSVTSIGRDAFYYCSSLTSVTIPNSVTSIGGHAFRNCSGLTSVTIGNSVTSIGEGAFAYCSGLTSVTIPNSVKSIGRYAFEYCSGLTSVTIPNSVTDIGGGAFEYCSGLTSVTIGNSVTSIGEYAFRNCSALTSVTIPNSVTDIGEGAFAYCSGLTSVTIGNSVTSIGKYAFIDCSGLTSVHISDIAAWCNIDFEYDNSNPLNYANHLYMNGEEVRDLVIPNSVTSIGEWAFNECSGLTSVTIPNSVTSIGRFAFSHCSGLTSVTIPNSVTSIESGVFYECSGLTSVTIGNSVTGIGSSAFRGCPDLLDVYCYAENVPSTESYVFNGSYPENATLHVPDASIDSYKARAPWSSFGKIVGLSGEEPEQPEVEKCATPVVTYVDGCLEISCDTDGANYVTKLAAEDANEYYESKIELSATYNIDVFAAKANYENSDTVSVALVWVENGDVNEETGVISVPAAPVLVQGNDGILTVSGVVQNTEVVVYTIDGMEVDRAVASDGTATIYTGLQSGTIVVVKFGNKSVKVRI